MALGSLPEFALFFCASGAESKPSIPRRGLSYHRRTALFPRGQVRICERLINWETDLVMMWDPVMC
ncbi:hypothetical protein, variant [Blastomyces dermatitidis ATCC 18188]|uniref:Uncharacterized protein n=1 Tax=Ajellomyces dermatitidis (strain ATCC 18188 / CBS 674.68) TaxID=653446 RepID=A0A0J9HJ00_AJEDA|nr:hypothetical protein BDFG_08832 [Blastomyces dermatitidis ATCC 26199]KMW69159.1 hypothetical protein BDDG_13327 [Blastomyces dermatitidis ATCC 18188]KMW69160.1 hypothetical protein, variant [Blastomyces dermatitidis ATCC 18188]